MMEDSNFEASDVPRDGDFAPAPPDAAPPSGPHGSDVSELPAGLQGTPDAAKPTGSTQPAPESPDAVRIGFSAVGEWIGPYRILQRIGKGGMGMVYRAMRREPHEQEVALKLLLPGSESRETIARFEAERQALALMDHPNIAKVFDAGETSDGRPYFVMEYVRGEPITTYCDKQRLTPRERLQLLIPVCEAVQHAHNKGIIHRDLSPSNILVSVEQSQVAAKIIDFGIAKAVGRKLTADTIATSFGQLLGKVEYMAPEQAEATAADVDTRADIYALGVILYELVVGARPFAKDLRERTLIEIHRFLREEEPPRPITRFSSLGASATDVAKRMNLPRSELERTLRGEIEWIPLKAMRKDRTRRYRTAVELADDIRNYLDDRPLIAGPETWSYRGWKIVKRHRLALGTAAIVLAAVVVGGTVATIGWVKASRAEARATRSAEQASRERDGAVSLVRATVDAASDLSRSKSIVETRAQLIGAALAETRRWVAEAATPVNRELLARILIEHGEVLGGAQGANLGDPRAALEAFAEAERIRAELLKETPSRPDLRLDFADAHLKQALLLVKEAEVADSAAALRHCDEGLRSIEADGLWLGPATRSERTTIPEELLKRGRRLRSALLFERGRAMLVQREIPGAQLNFGASVAIREQNLEAWPEDATMRRDMATGLDALAVLASGDGRAAESIALFERKLAIQRQLAAEAPGDNQTIRDVLSTLTKLAKTTTTSDPARSAATAELLVPQALEYLRIDPLDDRAPKLLLGAVGTWRECAHPEAEDVERLRATIIAAIDSAELAVGRSGALDELRAEVANRLEVGPGE